jgi:hypothetical protein
VYHVRTSAQLRKKNGLLYPLQPFKQSYVYVPGGLLHELSNLGAQEQMSLFLEEMLLPRMVACSQVG